MTEPQRMTVCFVFLNVVLLSSYHDTYSFFFSDGREIMGRFRGDSGSQMGRGDHTYQASSSQTIIATRAEARETGKHEMFFYYI